MTNKKLTLGCPIRKLHLDAQSESHTESYKQNLDTFADSPSGYDHATVSTFIGWCPSFHYHLLLKLLNSIISPHPSSKSPKTDNCCFNSISLLPFHLCLLKISKAMSISSWRKMSLSRPMRWWMVSLVLWEYGAKVGETLKQGEEGGVASMPLLDQQQGHFKEILGRGLTRCAYFLLLLEKDFMRYHFV